MLLFLWVCFAVLFFVPSPGESANVKVSSGVYLLSDHRVLMYDYLWGVLFKIPAPPTGPFNVKAKTKRSITGDNTNPVGEVYKYFFGLETERDFAKLSGEVQNVAASIPSLEKELGKEHQELVVLNAGIRNLSEEFKVIVPNIIHNRELIERSYYELGLQQCRMHVLPAHYITREVLGNVTDFVLKSLQGEGFELAISDVRDYYTNRVSWCEVLDSSMDISLTLQVPYREKLPEYKFFHVTAVPYHHQICTIDNLPQYVVTAGDKIIEIPYKNNFDCAISADNFMCRLPPHVHQRGISNTCISKVIKATSFEEMTSSCPLKCTDSSSLIITKLWGEKISVVNAKNITSICSKGKGTYFNATEIYGNLEVDFSDGCDLYIDSHKFVKPYMSETARKEPLVIHTIPSAFSNIQTLSPKFDTMFSNLSQIMNNNWSHDVPNINISSTPSDFGNAKMTEVVEAGNSNIVLLSAWLGVVSVAIVGLYVKMFICGGGGGGGLGVAGMLLLCGTALAGDAEKSEPKAPINLLALQILDSIDTVLLVAILIVVVFSWISLCRLKTIFQKAKRASRPY